MEILNFIPKDKFEKKNQILIKMQLYNCRIEEREFRRFIEENNNDWNNGRSPYFIAHSSKGYKATNDKKEIISSITDNKKRALNQLVKVSKTLKRIGESINLSIDFEQVEDDKNEI